VDVNQKPYGKRIAYVLSVDLKDSESALIIIVSGNEFQTVGAEQRKARLAKSVLVNGLSSSGTADERSVRSLTMLASYYCVPTASREVPRTAADCRRQTLKYGDVSR